MKSEIEQINELADHVVRLQVQEKSFSADLRRVKSAIAEAEYKLVQLMVSNKLTTIGSTEAVAELEEKIVPEAVDWGALHDFIRHTGDFDLLHRRLSLTSFKERYQAGSPVPGVEARLITTVKVSRKG